MTNALSIQNAYLAYDGTVLFDDLNMTLEAGKFTCLLGPSGIGKSTLLKLIAGLFSANMNNTVFRGDIQNDQAVAYMGQTDLLLPWLSALDNALLGAKLRAAAQDELETLTNQAKHLFQLVGLEQALALLPNQLSGGMRQRVALVRTLIEDKPIVLMDEPFSALDAITRFHLQTLTVQLLKGRTVFFITHDPLEALRMADEIYIMSGQPARVYSPLELSTPIPRDLSSQEVMDLQAELFRELVMAKEVSV